MDIDLSGRVAIVTGSARGIGRSIAHTLAEHGARVAVADIDLETAANVAQEITDTGREAISVQVDVTDSTSVQAMVNQCLADWPAVVSQRIGWAIGLSGKLRRRPGGRCHSSAQAG